jgi:hypothetical protein
MALYLIERNYAEQLHVDAEGSRASAAMPPVVRDARAADEFA